ncbi:MAG: circularly permuted type 2 ATP-grasp protein [Marinobacter sp.]|nr:circularly permuted type 2 ATP-grasp protein [Marinobacter sp.]
MKKARTIDWKSYDPAPFYDELIAAKNKPRPCARTLTSYLAALDSDEIQTRQQAAELAILEMGISFTIYSEGENIDRAWPFDIIPRVIPRSEWQQVEKGLTQRLTALNLFINDIYNDQHIVRDKIIPKYVFANSKNFREQCQGFTPPLGVWAHICGSDLVRDKDGTLYVLEDNLRVPSGVSYMLENRHLTKRVFPELFENSTILPVDDYTNQLFDMLASISPRPMDYPKIAVLTPGIFNSAYFEHSFLAQRMGAQLVEGADLFVDDDDCVYMRTIHGPERVDVIYRRIDDEFLDPEAFRPDSMLGVPGLMRAWRKGNVGLANAPGAGVADDKVIYAYVPDMIRYYLKEEPIIPNVPTWLCVNKPDREYVLKHLDELVVKPANESGGYGMLVGPHSTKKQRSEFASLIKKNPRNYIAQPTLGLSVAPTLCEEGLEPRHLDLRPFVLQGVRTYVTAGGLTRVAMRKGSLVVNSSQGGGSKDTWIVEEDA